MQSRQAEVKNIMWYKHLLCEVNILNIIIYNIGVPVYDDITLRIVM